MILVEGSRRTILEAPKGGRLPSHLGDHREAPRSSDAERCWSTPRSARLQLRAARRVRDAGGFVMLDCGHPREGVDALVACSDIAIFSHTYPRARHGARYDREAFLRETLDRLPESGPAIVGLTLGAEGCVIASRDDGVHWVGAPTVKAVDTTGAGDVFHGAYLHAFLKTASPIVAARFANLVASEKCKAMTGRAPLPSPEELWSRV